MSSDYNKLKGANARSDARIKTDYEDLFKSYEELQSRYRAIAAKHKSSIKTINKLKKELQSWKLRRVAGRGFHKKVQKSSGGCVKAVLNNRVNEATDNFEEEDYIQREQVLERLGTAEEKLKSLCEESSRSSSRSDANALTNDLRRQLNETTTKLNLLQARNEYAESKIKAQGEKLEKILLLHGEYKSKYASLKRELQVCRQENEALEAKALDIDELKDLLSELTEQNRFLERQVVELTPVYVHDERTLTELLREKQAAYDALISERSQLRKENERLRLQIDSLDHGSADQEESKNLEKLRQQCNEQDRELQRTIEMLQAQFAINSAQEEAIKEREACCREQLKTYRNKADELTIKSSQRLQRIRLLESKLSDLGFAHCSSTNAAVSNHSSLSLGPDENVLEVHIANGSLESTELTEESLSFILIDFLSFESMCSSIKRGINPTYDFIISYKLDVDRFILQNIADGHMQIEVYTLQSITETPLLFASASMSTSDLLLSGRIHLPKLKLSGPGDKQRVGTVTLTLQLAQPLGHQVSEQIDNENYYDHQLTEGDRITPDAIKIVIDRVVLTNNHGHEDQRPAYYFVHYNFLGDELTNLESCNDNGEIVFQHETSYPILSTPQLVDGKLSRLSEGSLRFLVFGGGNDKNDQKFSIVGEAHALMSDLLERRTLLTQIVSLQARVVGTINIFCESLRPTSNNLTNNARICLRDNLVAKLKEVFVELANKSTDCLRKDQLLNIIDPPVEIAQTADLLQCQIQMDCPGKALSDVFTFPCNETALSWHNFQCCLDRTRCKGLLSKLPPNQEMMDLFQYLSQNDGLVKVNLLNFFVASEPLKHVITSFRGLKRMKLADRNDILCIENELDDWVTTKSLTNYFQGLLDCLEEDHQWIAVFPNALN
ncbi:hypothetical protein HJC23_008998 [Cyclotella cryptica]|uniref:RPGR-interacting protein 1 first C2 domain-containing protein n=1 Tax=Cyclotella cryptica TaxID=29204 RepID=A0ABD3QZV1_9STRA|eukprot:CCRYP_000583-RA/>CCRYP_000583-RA protein AED:0.12 eAED:0.12 QI:0/-1/0/1/-1/1/1/0/894